MSLPGRLRPFGRRLESEAVLGCGSARGMQGAVAWHGFGRERLDNHLAGAAFAPTGPGLLRGRPTVGQCAYACRHLSREREARSVEIDVHFIMTRPRRSTPAIILTRALPEP